LLLAWFKNELLAAKGNFPLIVWACISTGIYRNNFLEVQQGSWFLG